MVVAGLVLLSAVAVKAPFADLPSCVDMCVSCTHSAEQLRLMQERGVRGDAECAHELSNHFKLEGRIDRPRTLFWGYIAAVNGSIHAAASLETYRQHLNYGVPEFLKDLSSIKFDTVERETGVEDYVKYLISLLSGDEVSENNLSNALVRTGIVLPRNVYLQKMRGKATRSILPFRCICITMPAPSDAPDTSSAKYWIRVPEPNCSECNATNAVNCTCFCCGVDVKCWQKVLRSELCLDDEDKEAAVVLAAYPDGSEYSNYDICIQHVERFLACATRKFGFPVRVSKYVDAEGKEHIIPNDGKDAVPMLARLISSDVSMRKVRKRQ